jgi:von Willebrand factor type A domain.
VNTDGGTRAGGGGGAGGSGGGSQGGVIILPPLIGGAGGNQPSVPRDAEVPTEDANCGLSTNDLTRLPAEVLLVLDNSGTMISSKMPSGLTRWVEAMNAFDQVLPATDANLNWGLMLYPGPYTGSSNTGKCTVGQVDVPVAPSNGATVMAAYRARAQNDTNATPTTATVNAAVAYLQQRTTSNPKYIVLATDGEPNCASPGDTSVTAQTRDAAVNAIAASKAAGIPVFVVGISTSGTTGSTTLDRMADAGGQALASSPRYYSANTQAELVTAMGQISGKIASCLFTMASAPPDPANVAVKFSDGTVALRDPAQTNGWNYTDSTNTRIQLFGPPCDSVMNGTYTDVKILFGCPGQIFW